MDDPAAHKLERGAQAEGIFNSPAFKDAVESVRNQYVKSWMEAPTAEQRELCHSRVIALSDVLKDLQSMITTGLLTRQSIDALQGKPSMWRTMSG